MDAKLLRQVNGVGPVTSLAYVLTLETPQRFKRSRDVGPYLGLVPQQEDSGDGQPQLGISKAGDRMLRKLLVGSAHYILGPFEAGHRLTTIRNETLPSVEERTPKKASFCRSGAKTRRLTASALVERRSL